MRILNICIRDYAGLTFRLTDAINKHTEHESRQLIMAKHKWGYPYDIFTKDGDEIRKWIDWADVVNCWGQTYPLRVAGKIPDKLIITHVGSYFRRSPEERHKEALELGAKELVCTPDLLIFPEFMWLPNAAPVDEWAKMKREHSGKPIVCQSPSSQKRKNTQEIRRLLRYKENIELEIIRLNQWEECMRRKAMADIYLGSFNIGYGMSSLEAWAMSIPVINYIVSPHRELNLREIGYLPYYESPIERLSEAVDALLEDRLLYEKYAKLGYEYVKAFHDYPVVAEKFTLYCEELIQAP